MGSLIYPFTEEMVVDGYSEKGIFEDDVFLLINKEWEVSFLKALFIRAEMNVLCGILREFTER